MSVTRDLPDFDDQHLRIEPIERAATIPATWYTDPRFHAIDLEHVFAKSWQGITHEIHLNDVGAFVTTEVAGNPVIVVRDENGTLRAFYNVCRHRGGPLAVRRTGKKVIQCRYHGWTYTLDGALRGVPKFNRVELFDRKDFGLVPIAVDVWEGLVFVNLDPNAPSLDATFAGVRERVQPVEPARMRFERRVDYDNDCNWKVYVDNFLEGYHIPFVHPELCKLYDFRHYRTEVTETYLLQTSPLSEDENVYTLGGGEAFYYFFFPNFMLNIVPGRVQTNLVVPTSHDTCRVTFWYYYAETQSREARQRIEEDIRFSDHVQHEDIDICQRVQRGLASRAYHAGRFSVEQEECVYHFQRMLKQHYTAAKALNRR